MLIPASVPEIDVGPTVITDGNGVGPMPVINASFRMTDAKFATSQFLKCLSTTKTG